MIGSQLSFIGAGNMNRAIIEGLLAADIPAQQLAVSNRSPDKLNAFESLGLVVSYSNVHIVEQADVVVLGVKPSQILGVVKEIREALYRSRPLLISLAAGIQTPQILAILGADYPLVRAMPNTPATIGEGAAGLYATAGVSNEQRVLAKAIIDACGVSIWVDDEVLIDTVIAVAGSAPAYFFSILETLIDEAHKCGLPAEDARILAVQTCLGAAKLFQHSETNLATLRNNVTSPGGTTQAALETFARLDLDGTLRAGMQAAIQRAQQLALETQ